MELNIDQIEKLLPHRYPFLLVDRIVECVPGQSAVGRKCVTANEPFFQGHFPGFKVMPGVLIVEAMAQCGGIMVLRNIPDPENYSTYFMKLTARRGPVGFGTAEARVDGKLACKAELTFALTDKPE